MMPPLPPSFHTPAFISDIGFYASARAISGDLGLMVQIMMLSIVRSHDLPLSISVSRGKLRLF